VESFKSHRVSLQLCHIAMLINRTHSFRQLSLIFFPCDYAQKQLLLSARLSHRNSVRPSVCHTGG